MSKKNNPKLPAPKKPSKTGLSLPAKTPMYAAVNAARYQRQGLIKQLQGSDRHLLCYVAGNAASITRDDTVGIVELLHNVPRGSNIDFLLHTGGGDIDAAEKIVSLLRTTVGKKSLRVIIPDFAKSAGTLIALAAEKIVMSDSSELGPIDPQFLKRDGEGNKIWHSVLSYLNAYQILCKKLRETPGDVPAKIMLSKLDPTTVEQFEAVKTRARKLAEEHLNRWMFHKTKGTYTKIASDLMDIDKWPAHGQMVSWEDAKEMGLEVQYLSPESDEWRGYWSLYCLQRLSIKDCEKLFESDYASLPMDSSS